MGSLKVEREHCGPNRALEASLDRPARPPDWDWSAAIDHG